MAGPHQRSNMSEQITDRAQFARVRILQHAIAVRALAIPPDCSRRSRAVRIGKIRESVGAFYTEITERQLWGPGSIQMVIRGGPESDRWGKAFVLAWVEAAAA
jgi:hypothetical protein